MSRPVLSRICPLLYKTVEIPVFKTRRAFENTREFGETTFRAISISKYEKGITALLTNLRTLKFKARPTNSFFANVNQMFGGSSQLRTTAVRCFFV